MYCTKTKLSSLTAHIRVLVIAFGLLHSFSVNAQSTTDTIDVSATVVALVPSCSVNISSVDFGGIDAGESIALGDYDQNFSMSFSCTEAVIGATATFDGGQNLNGAVRRMAGPANARISYTINEPPSSTIIPGETLTFDLTSGNNVIPLVARVSTQTIPNITGTYSDTITVTFVL